MTWLGVDLAQRYSAAVMLDESGTVLWESVSDFGALSRPPTMAETLAVLEKAADWANEIANAYTETSGHRLGVENVHHRAINSTPVIRIQGSFLLMLADTLPELVPVNAWQKHFGYKKTAGMTSKGWAKEMCDVFGYVPGKTLADGSSGKGSVDLRDAYLIARYLLEQSLEETDA